MVGVQNLYLAFHLRTLSNDPLKVGM